MKKFLLAILAAVLLLPGMSFACTTPGFCDFPIIPLAGSAEAQAFQNLDISYGQDAGVQKINQTSWKNEVSTSYAIDGNIYGSIHTSPDTLFFVGLDGSFVKTNTTTNSVTGVCATVYAMNGGVKMAADAGASAVSVGWSGAGASAGNNAIVNQFQTLNFGGMGYGTTAVTSTGFTNVKAGF